MNHEIFERENVEESFHALGIDPATPVSPLIKPLFKFIDH
jgi:hypothetical protein